MKKTNKAFTLVEMIVVILLLGAIGFWISLLFRDNCTTADCVEAKHRLLEAESNIEQRELEAERKYRLEAKKIEAQIEANKPTEVKVAEIQASEMTVWEWIGTAAALWAGAWVFGKILEWSY